MCADINDFRDMAADADMAVRFYKIGDAADLAGQLIAILQSPALQRSMGEQNFKAGLEMTMASVVRNYLRWFELNKHKRTIRHAGAFPGRRFTRLRSLFSRPSRALRSGSLVKGVDGMDGQGRELAGNNAQTVDFADPRA